MVRTAAYCGVSAVAVHDGRRFFLSRCRSRFPWSCCSADKVIDDPVCRSQLYQVTNNSVVAPSLVPMVQTVLRTMHVDTVADAPVMLVVLVPVVIFPFVPQRHISIFLPVRKTTETPQLQYVSWWSLALLCVSHSFSGRSRARCVQRQMPVVSDCFKTADSRSCSSSRTSTIPCCGAEADSHGLDYSADHCDHGDSPVQLRVDTVVNAFCAGRAGRRLFAVVQRPVPMVQPVRWVPVALVVQFVYFPVVAQRRLPMVLTTQQTIVTMETPQSSCASIRWSMPFVQGVQVVDFLPWCRGRFPWSSLYVGSLLLWSCSSSISLSWRRGGFPWSL